MINKKKEIEKVFMDMCLVHNYAHDFWCFPLGFKSTYQFELQTMFDVNGVWEIQIRITERGDVKNAKHYMPDQGIKTIQRMIQKMFNNQFQKRFGFDPGVQFSGSNWYLQQELLALQRMKTNFYNPL